MPEAAIDERATEAGEDVLRSLRRLILSGELSQGTKLREAGLASQFGVSRTPIREALTVLESEGLVTYELNRGFAVRRYTLRDVLECYEMRSLLEGHACRIAAERGVPPDVEREINRCLDGADILVNDCPLDKEAMQQWQQHNMRFHTLLVESVRNSVFQRMAHSVYQVPRIVNIFQFSTDVDGLRAYNADHRRIFSAVIMRQSGRAEFLMREHLQESCDLITQMLSKHANAEVQHWTQTF